MRIDVDDRSIRQRYGALLTEGGRVDRHTEVSIPDQRAGNQTYGRDRCGDSNRSGHNLSGGNFLIFERA